MTRCLLILLALALAAPARATDPVPERDLQVILDNATDFLRTQQAENGAFGTAQPHLQSSLALLALLSRGDAADHERIERTVRYLVDASSRSGNLGDDVYAIESHAITFTALLAALPELRDEELREETAKLLSRALRHTQRTQDRSSAGSSRGGWKMEGTRGRENDRRSSTWALLSYYVAQLYGLEVPESNVVRGLQFVLAAGKGADADRADQAGGFSVDAEGLAVASISAMGSWLLATLQPRSPRLPEAAAWLDRNPPVWSGPNYFYTNFFRLRALHRARPPAEAYQRAMRAVYLQLREHQQPTGAIDFPPGNAQNTVAMGPAFSTAMAILLLNLEASALPFDQDWRPLPLLPTETPASPPQE